MKKLLIVFCISALGGIACGGSGGCPGLVCSDCGGSGDCNIDCQPPDVEFCGAFGYFDDPTLRCAFCAPESFQP
ncbi:MAG: hypothetical protein OEM15_07785 [Myxococcales bacterium]|nr:hypothetical protein [Myxococcales bacterium]